MKTVNPESKFAVSITVLFFAVGLFLILHHEMWHDETCEWLIARDSRTYVSLLKNYTQMTHPIGWVSLLWLLTKVTLNIFSMQLLNLSLATAAIYIFTRFAPFPRVFKCLFSFGYFPVYEYAAISREYALGMLVLFVFALFYHDRWKKFLLFSFVVALLANSSLMTFVFSVIIFVFLLSEAKFLSAGSNKKRLIAGFLLMSAGILFSLTRILPYEKLVSRSNPAMDVVKHKFFANGLDFFNAQFLFLKTLFSRAFFPIPCPFLRFWEAHIFALMPDFFMLLSAAVLVFTIILFRKEKKYLVLWLSIVCFFYLFTLICFFRAAMRHFGFLYLFFIICLWICFPAEDCRNLSFFKNATANFRLKRVINLILLIHIIGACIAVYWDWFYPFTQAKNVAAYIRSNHLENKTIVGWRDDFMPSIIAYAGLKQIYYPQGERFGSFVLFDAQREKPIKLGGIIKPVIKLQKEPEDFLFILTPDMFEFRESSLEDIRGVSELENMVFDIYSFASRYRFRRIAVFSPSIVLGENFVLYELEKVQ